MHWGEGRVVPGPGPGPDDRLCLSPEFVDTVADLQRLQATKVHLKDRSETLRSSRNFNPIFRQM